MSDKHTPGPWVSEECWLDADTLHEGTYMVQSRAQHLTWGQVGIASRVRRIEDARLIAAAPEMLRCLEWLRDDIKQKIHPLHPNDDWLSPALREIESAISAATETLTTTGKEGE
jgi:hypothetical protein